MLDLTPFFSNDTVYLSPPDQDGDAETILGWYGDPEFAALIQREPVRPLKIEEIRRKIPSTENDPNRFLFAIHLKADGRLVGLIEIGKILWSNGVGFLAVQIGEEQDRRCGYGSQSLALMLRFAFDELNLNKIISLVNGYNQAAQLFFEKNGFTLEIRQLEALLRRHRRWDLLWMGMTRSDWAARRAGGVQ